jgi:hypothetical protein
VVLRQSPLVITVKQEKKKVKLYQLYAMEAQWGRGGIAPTYA